MNKYMIHGGHPLFGEVTISGAKNAAVAIIPAALLVDGVCRIENIPQISDVTLFFSILDELGARVRVLNQHAVEIDCRTVRSTHPSYDMARRIRASYYLLGALLGRFGEATVAMPGGCNFGVRPIDQHVKGFRAMGAEVTEGNFVHAAAIIIFMVAPTLTTSRYTDAPTRRPFLAAVWMKPPSTDTSAPMVVKPLICWSMGRTPKLQPPGMATVAWPKRPSSAPSR